MLIINKAITGKEKEAWHAVVNGPTKSETQLRQNKNYIIVIQSP